MIHSEFSVSGKSFKCIKNCIHPNTLPCGMEQFVMRIEEYVFLPKFRTTDAF